MNDKTEIKENVGFSWPSVLGNAVKARVPLEQFSKPMRASTIQIGIQC